MSAFAFQSVQIVISRSCAFWLLWCARVIQCPYIIYVNIDLFQIILDLRQFRIEFSKFSDATNCPPKRAIGSRSINRQIKIARIILFELINGRSKQAMKFFFPQCDGLKSFVYDCSLVQLLTNIVNFFNGQRNVAVVFFF